MREPCSCNSIATGSPKDGRGIGRSRGRRGGWNATLPPPIRTRDPFPAIDLVRPDGLTARDLSGIILLDSEMSGRMLETSVIRQLTEAVVILVADIMDRTPSLVDMVPLLTAKPWFATLRLRSELARRGHELPVILDKRMSSKSFVFDREASEVSGLASHPANVRLVIRPIRTQSMTLCRCHSNNLPTVHTTRLQGPHADSDASTHTSGTQGLCREADSRQVMSSLGRPLMKPTWRRRFVKNAGWALSPTVVDSEALDWTPQR